MTIQQTEPRHYGRPLLRDTELKLLLRLVRQHLAQQGGRDFDARMIELQLEQALHDARRVA